VSAEAGATEATAEPRPPVPVTAAPEAAVTGSPEPVAATLPDESLPPTELTSEVTGYNLPPTDAPPEDVALPPAVPDAALAEAVRDEERAAEVTAVPGAGRTGRRERTRVSHSNALGVLIERHFGDPMSPCRSYSDLERRSGISREALSRYVTSRSDRRRSPTIDTLVAIADAMHLSLESVCRAAAASVKGMPLAPEEEQHAREEVLSALVVGLTDQQFSAVVELLRHLRPVVSAT
jgi:transcriptional regulator with XRE-family HTH domain